MAKYILHQTKQKFHYQHDNNIFLDLFISEIRCFFEKKFMIHIAVFASGSGTNCENLIQYFNNSRNIRVSAVVTNNPNAGVIAKANTMGVSCYINRFRTPDDFNTMYLLLEHHKISWIILAGFLKLIPEHLVKKFPDRIINLHPALLPKFGGKGMYGMNVHKAVIDANEKISGISVHLVNEQYDAGQIVAQFKCNVFPDDTPETLAMRVHELEYRHFPVVVEKIITDKE
jgi:phosphoribosylglycinamide formyltransferase-1